jgi:hypothetical protein
MILGGSVWSRWEEPGQNAQGSMLQNRVFKGKRKLQTTKQT